jgi:basic membrane protein A
LTKSLHIAMAILVATGLFISGCTPKSTDCRRPDVFCVGLVTEVGSVDDHAYNQAAWEGIQQAKSEGLADSTAYIETIDGRDYEDNLRVFADAGYDVIVAVGSASNAATYNVAGKYPKLFFIGTDQHPSDTQSSLPNLVWLTFPEDQLGFLAGAMAAAMTKTDQVGAVCGSDAWPPMKLYGDGFLSGALYINPNVRATVTYDNEVGLDETFSDPVWGAATANALIDNGADIIFGVGEATGNSALETAATRGAYAIGADIDQYYTLPNAAPRLLTSVLKLISPGVSDLIRIARNAQLHKNPFPMNAYIGRIGFAPYHDLSILIPDDVMQKMNALPQALATGEIHLEIPASSP